MTCLFEGMDAWIGLDNLQPLVKKEVLPISATIVESISDPGGNSIKSLKKTITFLFDAGKSVKVSEHIPTRLTCDLVSRVFPTRLSSISEFVVGRFALAHRNMWVWTASLSVPIGRLQSRLQRGRLWTTEQAQTIQVQLSSDPQRKQVLLQGRFFEIPSEPHKTLPIV